MFYNFIILFSFNFVISSEAGLASASACGRNEVFYDSTISPNCDANCQDLQRPACHRLTAQQAVAGCYCRRGYARNLRQQCIPLQQCVADCFPNEKPIYPLAEDCEKSCTASSKASVTICYRRMERKCVCLSQYCRNNRAQCIKASVS